MAAPTATWDQTPEGQNLQNAYNQLLNAYNNKLPAHSASLSALATRPITG